MPTLMRLAAEQAKLEAILQAGDGHEPGTPNWSCRRRTALPPWDASPSNISVWW